MKKFFFFAACLAASATMLAQEIGVDKRTMTVSYSGVPTTFFVDNIDEISFGLTTCYPLIVSGKEGGTVLGEGYYPLGTKVNLMAKPDEGYLFSYWMVDGNCVYTSTTTVEVTNSTSVEVVFLTPEDYLAANTDKYVDLGLPSGTLWATCNLGATSPEEFGDYFAWGETEPKTDARCSWDTYRYCMYDSEDDRLIKYCSDEGWGLNGFTDNKLELDAEDDAAWKNTGGTWRMPTQKEWQELIEYCTAEWFEGGLLIRCNDPKYTDELFLPAAGYRYERYFTFTNQVGFYWSSSLREENQVLANTILFDFDGILYEGGDLRANGISIRPVLTVKALRE